MTAATFLAVVLQTLVSAALVWLALTYRQLSRTARELSDEARQLLERYQRAQAEREMLMQVLRARGIAVEIEWQEEGDHQLVSVRQYDVGATAATRH